MKNPSDMCLLFVIWTGITVSYAQCQHTSPLVLAHWMPWFYPDPPDWGWPPYHGGMYYLPIIGHYSSQDTNVINWQLALMDHVGINGVIVDWYGTSGSDPYDFRQQATDALWTQMKTNFPNMKLGICYDFHSIPTNGQFDQDMQYLQTNYFSNPQYLTYTDGNPVMLLWATSASSILQEEHTLINRLQGLGLGNLYVSVQYNDIFKNPHGPFQFDTTNQVNKIGIFDWKLEAWKSDDKTTQIQQVKDDINKYYVAANSGAYQSEFAIGSLYNGFSDHYVANGEQTTNPYNLYGFINQDYGYLDITYDETYNNGYCPYILQVTTWNDYAEGTMIEPNVPTYGCVKGCGNGPYDALVTLYQLFKDSSKSEADIQQELELITAAYFP